MNGRIKSEKESLVFFSHKKLLLLPSHPFKHPCTCYATLYYGSRYYLTVASFLSFAIVRLLCRYCAPEAALSTGYKYKRLSERKKKGENVARYIFAP